MQYRINSTQPLGIPGQEIACSNSRTLPRYTEDNNCEAGKFAFGGTNPEIQVLGIEENTLYNGYT